MIRMNWRTTILQCLTAMLTLPALAAPRAEYALRWDPAAGGPQDAQQVRNLLSLAGAVETSAFEVGYFSVLLPAETPADAAAVVRERIQPGHPAETTWKYRWDAAPAPAVMAGLVCPLKSPTTQKFEVDVTLLDAAQVRRTHAWSCESAASVFDSVPAKLAPMRKGCSSRMQRWHSKAARLKIEQWLLSNGQRVLEVSWTGQDRSQDLERFIQRFARPLLAAGLHALDRSKTEIGTQCGS